MINSEAEMDDAIMMRFFLLFLSLFLSVVIASDRAPAVLCLCLFCLFMFLLYHAISVIRSDL